MGALNLTVLVGALGYFVDIYDLVLFSIVRTPSLKELGVSEAELLDVGVKLLNWQMSGLLLGGLLWGILGDRRGRVSVLFGSILLYSSANIANGFVTSIPLYAALRFLAGVGLAGELGAAITLVSEILPKETRGYGTAIVAGVGLSGAVAAGLVGDLFSWRTAYFTGGTLGLLLLLMRVRLLESGVYREMDAHGDVRRGDVRMLFTSRHRLMKYLYCILIGVPVWYVVGILVTFSPEITRAAGVTDAISAGRAILFCYAGVSLGDIGSGFLSQWLKSRRKVIACCLGTLSILVVICLFSREYGAAYFYGLCFVMGLATGYWAVFMTISAEQFGTNLRATVTTSTPNFVRGSVVLLSSSFHALKPSLGVLHSALAVGVSSLLLAFWSLWHLQETYGAELNYVERD